MSDPGKVSETAPPSTLPSAIATSTMRPSAGTSSAGPGSSVVSNDGRNTRAYASSRTSPSVSESTRSCGVAIATASLEPAAEPAVRRREEGGGGEGDEQDDDLGFGAAVREEHHAELVRGNEHGHGGEPEDGPVEIVGVTVAFLLFDLAAKVPQRLDTFGDSHVEHAGAGRGADAVQELGVIAAAHQAT